MSVEKILEEFGTKLKEDVQLNLINKQKAKASHYGTSYNANSNLVNSVKFVISNKSGVLLFELKMADYFNWVDRGRASGNVSESGQKSISRWIKTKALNPVKIITKMREDARTKAGTQGTYKPRKKLTFEKATKAFTFLVARKLQKHGYSGNFFYSEIILDGRLDQLKLDIQKELNDEVEIIIKDFNE